VLLCSVQFIAPLFKGTLYSVRSAVQIAPYWFLQRVSNRLQICSRVVTLLKRESYFVLVKIMG